MAHIHSVFDSNEHFVIDPVTRAIANSLAKKIVVMQFDHNSERFTFEIPKLVDGHNMSVCDKVEIHYINVDAVDKTLKSTGVYEVDDIQPSPDDNSVAAFSWLLSRNCTKYAGTLSFLIHFACTTDGVEDYAWNTAIFQSITIGNGMNNGAEVIEPYADIIAQWKADLFGVGDTQEQRLLTVSAEQQAAIAAKGAAVLESIPDEYEALQAQADENTRIKAGAIVLDAEGESIVVNDASDCYLRGLKVFGKSTQDGTPTPDAPVEIIHVVSPTVSIRGENQFDENGSFKGGSIIANIDNGVVSLSGESSAGYGVLKTYSGYGFFKKGETYRISSTYGKFGLGFWFKNSEKAILGILSTEAEDTHTLTIPEEVESVDMFYAKVEIGVSVDLTDQFMIVLGNNPKPFEAHKKQTVTIGHKLPGIPVHEGGNYTDADGQQWICDEVDLKRGVYVKRIKAEQYHGDVYESWALHTAEGINQFYRHVNGIYHSADEAVVLCDYYRPIVIGDRVANYNAIYTSSINICINTQEANSVSEWRDVLANRPIHVQYALATPIETPLSDAEITAFKALHSNKPVTTILNDAGAFMAVEYVADTKTYIDNKIKELMEGSE